MAYSPVYAIGVNLRWWRVVRMKCRQTQACELPPVGPTAKNVVHRGAGIWMASGGILATTPCNLSLSTAFSIAESLACAAARTFGLTVSASASRCGRWRRRSKCAARTRGGGTDMDRVRWEATRKHCTSVADLQRAVRGNGPSSPCLSGCRSVCWKVSMSQPMRGRG